MLLIGILRRSALQKSNLEETKVVDKLLGIRRGECGTEFGCEVLRGGLARLIWASKVKSRLVMNEERGLS